MNISFVNRYRYFIYRGGCDMRKGYDGLCGLVINEFKMSPLSGDVFVFLSKPRNKIKILHWQGDGFVIYSKRLEKDWKNYLFAGSYEVAENAAMFYSLLGTCKLKGIEPFEWLKSLFEKLPDWKANRLEELLP